MTAPDAGTADPTNLNRGTLRRAKTDWQIIVGLLVFTVLALASVLLTQFTTDIPHPTPHLAWVEEARFSPEGDTQAKRVSLPHDWKLAQIPGTMGRYQFQAKLADGIQDLQPSLYIPHAIQSFTLTVNSHPQPTGLPSGTNAHLWNTPKLVTLDPRFVQPGVNHFTLELSGHPIPGDNYLSRIYVGPKSVLEPLWQENHLTRVDVIKTLTTIMLWLSSAMSILFALRRQEAMFGWFSLGILFAALYNANFIVKRLPLPYEQWQALIFAALMLSVLCLIVTSNRLSGITNRRFERVIFAVALIGFVPLLLPGVATLWLHSYGFGIWIVLVLLFGLIAYGVILRHRLQQGNGQEALFILAAGTLVATFGLNDILTLNGILQRDRPLLLSYGFFTLIVSQAWFVLTRFAGALNTLEDLNADLDARVRAREGELTILHQEQVKAARERTLAQERERLMQDMHDGVGGRLISTLSLLEVEQISLNDVREEIRNCLEDVRLTIESLDIEARDIASLLGSFRYQMQPRLKRQGIQMIWKVAPLPEGMRFDPAQNLHFLRILQEGITNVLRHSEASKITISAALDDSTGKFRVTLCDNGKGMPESGGRRSGRGLGNMRSRAAVLGGELAIGSGPNSCGTNVTLTIPISAFAP